MASLQATHLCSLVMRAIPHQNKYNLKIFEKEKEHAAMSRTIQDCSALRAKSTLHVCQASSFWGLAGGVEIKFSPTAEIGLYGCMPRRPLWILLGPWRWSGVTHGPPTAALLLLPVPLELCQSKLEKGHGLEISTPGPSSWDFMVRLAIAFFVFKLSRSFLHRSSQLHLSASRRA